MTDARIDVYRDRAFLKTIERRIHEEDGHPLVRFRGVNYPVVDGCEIHVDEVDQGKEIHRSGELDSEQRLVAFADEAARLIVNAGPGMGKTRVGCARVVELIRAGVEPSNIWIISFTRTAVSEVRERIRILLAEEGRAAAVKVSTLDSHAWYFREGFEEEPRGIFSGYEENIDRAIEVLQKNEPMVQEYLGSLQHLVVDEAQDLVGSRAEMLELLIRRIPRACGVTVFTDDAQAIYGFSEVDEDPQSDDDTSASAATLPERLRKEESLGFASVELRTVHRTDSRRLQRLFVETRQLVLECGDPSTKLQQVRVEIESSADELLEEAHGPEIARRDDLLVLFRRRAEVLVASARLSRSGVTHRIRMSGYPPSMHPWVGVLLWDFTERYLRRTEFDILWSSRVATLPFVSHRPDDAWALLWRTAGAEGDRIEVRHLRAQLSRGQPPLGFISAEVGLEGPILGTIHASKGREAAHVDLMLPIEKSGYGDLMEEARVLFVGATRAREGMRVGTAPWCTARSLDSGRVYQPGSQNQSPRVRLELGRTGDLDDALLVSDRGVGTEAEVQEAQAFLLRRIGASFDLIAEQDATQNFTYMLHTDGEGQKVALGGLQSRVKQDLWNLAKITRPRQGAAGLRPPRKLSHIRVVGVRTVVLPEDHPELTHLFPPFDETRTFLAPVICGFPTAFFLKGR